MGLEFEEEEEQRTGRLYSPLQFIHSIFGTPIEEVLLKHGLRKREVKYLKRGEIYSWMEGALERTGLLDMYDQSALVWGSGYMSIIGYGTDYFKRNMVRINRPVEIVDAYASRRIIVFQDENGKKVYYDRARRVLSEEPLEQEVREKEKETLRRIINETKDMVKPPYSLIHYTRTTWVVAETSMKSREFAYVSSKRHSIKTVNLGVSEADIGGYSSLLYTGHGLLLPMKLEYRRHQAKGLPSVLFIHLYYAAPKMLIEVL